MGNIPPQPCSYFPLLLAFGLSLYREVKPIDHALDYLAGARQTLGDSHSLAFVTTAILFLSPSFPSARMTLESIVLLREKQPIGDKSTPRLQLTQHSRKLPNDSFTRDATPFRNIVRSSRKPLRIPVLGGAVPLLDSPTCYVTSVQRSRKFRDRINRLLSGDGSWKVLQETNTIFFSAKTKQRNGGRAPSAKGLRL